MSYGGGMCGDDRFEIIEAAKKRLIEATNIESSPDEMKVLDSFLFRAWQMGWLDCIETPAKTAEPTAKRITPPDDAVVWVVYDNKGELFWRRENTWCGGVPFEAGPCLTMVELYEDHTAKVDAGRNYVSAVAWFYSEAEAQAYIDKAEGGSPC